jgi:predicted dehydrogenase
MQQRKTLFGAVYGAGFMGKTHLAGYQKLEDVTITGIIDPIIERAKIVANQFRLKSFSSIAEAVENHSLDFIDICIPTPFHNAAVKEAFSLGCDVLVEKPIVATWKDLEEIQALMEKTSRRFMAAHVCRFIAPYVYAKQTINSGRLGRPTLLSGKRYSQRPSWSHNDWINNRKQSGGTIIDLSIHDVDIANWFLGVPKHVFASEAVWVEQGPAHVLETLEYQDHCAAHVEASHLMPDGYGLDYEFQLVFEKGLISCRIGSESHSIREMTEGVWKDIDTREYVTYEEPYTEEVYHFTECLRSGKPFRIPFEDAVTAIKSVLLLQKSVIDRSDVTW